MLYAELRNGVLNNLGGDGQRVSGYHIDTWINEAYKNICARIAFIQSEILLDTVEYEWSIDLSGTDLTNRTKNIRRVLFTDNADAQYRLDFVTLEEYDYIKGVTTPTSGTPSVYSTWGNKIFLLPIPATSRSGNLKIMYVEDSPAKIDQTSGNLTTLPEYIQPAIIDYASYRAFMKLGNMNIASSFKVQYDAAIAEAKNSFDMDNVDGPSYVQDVTSI